MAKVAANQDHAEAERGHYVYLQHARITSRKGKTVLCEEITDSRIAPTATSSEAQLINLDGRVWQKHTYLHYTTLQKSKSTDIDIGDDDRELVESMRSSFTHDRSKDGLAAGLFPLTSKSQTDYAFHLAGREHLNGREVFHIDFHPKDKDGYGWRGDAYIDTTAFQPVVVRTAMARPIPFAVRTLLGTSVPGLGFTVVYEPVPDGIWFPVSFGTEFKLHVLFFYSREILLEARNSDFEKTHVSSKIVEAEAPVTQP
jgi:hypothetical protein